MISMPLAYMNPGTGGLLIQLIAVGIGSVFIGIRSIWHSIKSFWSQKKK